MYIAFLSLSPALKITSPAETVSTKVLPASSSKFSALSEFAGTKFFNTVLSIGSDIYPYPSNYINTYYITVSIINVFTLIKNLLCLKHSRLFSK